MKNAISTQESFRVLNARECESTHGGGFAYDAGFFLRLMSLGYSGTAGYWMTTEIASYIATQ